MRLGLIAGNGRFPFLVLDAARAMGHDVTVIAAREEAFADLNDAAAKAQAPIHWISLGELGTCIRLMKDAGITQAVMAGQVRHTKIFAGGIVPDDFAPLVDQLARDLRAATEEMDVVVAHNVCSLPLNLALTTTLHRLTRATHRPPLVAWHHDLGWNAPRYRALAIAVSTTA